MDLGSSVIFLFPAFFLTFLADAESSSWSQVYPRIPSGDYGPEWQDYFQVTNSLPNVTWPLAHNWAGNIAVQREDHPNDTLFFWAFESSYSSFTTNNDEPWGIWLNGDPGSSSLVGLLFENGPIRISNDYALFENQYAWSSVADYVWIDQPVGVGFGTPTQTAMTGFLDNLVKVFPSLATRPLHLMGESYAGMYIPYIMKACFKMDRPPVNLARIAIGDGTLTSQEVYTHASVVTVLETYPQIMARCYLIRAREVRVSEAWKRSLADRANWTVDPWYGCDLYNEMLDYAINFTFPWSLSKGSGGMFDVYDIPDVLNPEAPMNASVFLNDPKTRAAIHAPTSKNWVATISYPFGNNDSNSDPSVEPMAFLTELATNATAHNMTIIIYSGNDDSIIPHFGSEVAIQNTTFGGIQGFIRKPETPWYDDDGKFAGIVHQERSWTYVLAINAGHLLGHDNPVSALTLAREFIFWNNLTGLVTNTCSGSVTVVGGEVSSLGNGFITGQAGIYYGSATTESTYFFPTPTVEAWNEFMVTATPYP